MTAVGCKKASEPVPQSETHRWIAPAQGAIDVYVNQFTLSPTNGSILRPNFTGPSITNVSTSTNQKDKPPYGAKISYIGTKDGIDHYLVVITYPVGEEMKSETKEIFYRGSDIEIFRDSEYRIGIRPSTEKRTEQGAKGGRAAVC